MNFKPILIVHGEPNSIFLEIFFKTIRYKKFKSPLVLIGSYKILKFQMKKLKFRMDVKLIDPSLLNKIKFNNKTINIIDINYNKNINFQKISSKSNNYIKDCFETSFKILKSGITNKLINGPVSKKSFLNKKFLGITEYLANKTKANNNVMLIYNKELSVSPITTHLPLKLVAKKITKRKIIKNITLIDSFYKKNFGFNPKIAVVGLNPHCESIDKFNEDEKIIKPTIKYLSNKKINVKGPYSADTAFLKKNRENIDIIVGMYHDQVLTPIKTLFEYDAINITLGLPFIRISPDHGPNQTMLGQNKSNPLSLIRAIEFLDKN
ncbi:4-hydroxythreonine-4-phosphate dehydrogenase PdxA [Candidatus Pelagibacter communis]|uniref:4-hydroxythreonine-4-phosphate dehydrogenase PdxA n=1 Tax=Pelagibacter ubique TaxID=198252 RepID=UPI00092D33B5|nr:4-hydroxythreonine-4-phosphate dehydrogenase PdxA [Candidatus Pelagibacter ubique]